MKSWQATLFLILIVSFIFIFNSVMEKKNNNSNYVLNDEPTTSENDRQSEEARFLSTNEYTSRKKDTTKFTNKYGSSTTICAHSGCKNYIATSGDTNCCTVHSNKCLNCNKYIDEDAVYCMDCLTEAIGSSSSSSSNPGKSTYSYSSFNSSSSGKKGAGGYDMPNASDESFSDYVKRVDPDLYYSLFN